MSIKISLKTLELSTRMKIKEKQYHKDKLAVCLSKLLAINKSDNSEGLASVKSLRKLESSSGVSYPIIQKISKGERNPSLTTIVSIAEGLNISMSTLFKHYEEVTDKEVKEFQKQKKKVQ